MKKQKIVRKIRNRLKIGEYESVVQKEGYNESFVKGVKEGEVYYQIRVDRYGILDVKNHSEAITISSLTRIENKLDRLLKRKR